MTLKQMNRCSHHYSAAAHARLWLPLLAILPASSVIAADQGALISPGNNTDQENRVVVSATRITQAAFDLPLSIDVIAKDSIQNGQAMVNLSESLARIPGLVAQNRQNYAQDLQISSRGFGARSAFGVRGLRLYADNIPGTMPDGQGQVSHVDLGSAKRIEVLRGPFSALYGNSSGGVISIFTEDGRPGFALDGIAEFGSYGTQRFAVKASGEQGSVNYVLSGSHFVTDGYREHSAATRDTSNAKLHWVLDADSSITVVANAMRMHDVQDPLGLTSAQVDANPRGVDASAITFNTRKSVDQRQLGVNYERRLDHANSVVLSVYTGTRATTQVQAIPVSVQLPATSAGGLIDLNRDYVGTDLRWTHRGALVDKPLQWTVGLSYDKLDENRRGFENFVGTTLGVQGKLRRDESNRVSNLDQYVQAQWEPGERWLLLGGVRRSSVRVRSDDHYVVTGNGNDSGGVDYSAVNPVLGATFRFTPTVNLYASYGKGFETPTLNELSYRSTAGSNTGLNFGLAPAKSDNLELGIKARINNQYRVNVAVFHIDTQNEISVLANTGGRAVYQNVGATRRDGLELSVDADWRNGSLSGVTAHGAYTLMRTIYADSFCSGVCSATTRVAAGNLLPGVPRQSLYGEVMWRYAPAGFSAAFESRYSGEVFANDLNTKAAAGYVVMNARGSFEQKIGAWQLKQFVRIDNLANRQTIGSVIVNESNQRYFEPAPTRNYLLGLSARMAW